MKKMIEELTTQIQNMYESTPTIEEAEKLAAKFLHAQMILAGHLSNLDLDSRMKKSGLKRVKAAVYTEAVSSAEKKPTEAQLAAIVDTSEIVETAQMDFDTAEVEAELFKSYLSVMREAHIFCRGISRGNYS